MRNRAVERQMLNLLCKHALIEHGQTTFETLRNDIKVLADAVLALSLGKPRAKKPPRKSTVKSHRKLVRDPSSASGAPQS